MPSDEADIASFIDFAESVLMMREDCDLGRPLLIWAAQEIRRGQAETSRDGE